MYRIERFTIEPKTTTIKVGTKEFRLEPKVMEVLCLLIDNKGTVLSKEHILDTLWPQQILDPELVTRAIFEIRKVLCDDPKTPTFIKTIPKKGYMFIAKVEKARDISPFTINKKTPLRFLLLALIGLIVTLVYTYLGQIGRDNEASVQPATHAEMVHYTTEQNLLDFAYQESSDSLYVLRESKTGKQLLANNIKTGAIVQLATDDFKSITLFNNTLAAILCSDYCRLVQYVDGNWLHITRFDEAVYQIEISHDNSVAAIAYAEQNQRKIKLLSTQSWAEEFPFSQLGASATHPTFGADGKLYYLFQGKNKRIQLGFVNYDSGESGSVPLPFTRINSFAIADDFSFKIAGKHQGDNGIWLFNSDTESVALLKSLRPSESIQKIITTNNKTLTLLHSSTISIHSNNDELNIDHNSYNFNAVFGPSDNDIFYASNRMGSYDIWRTMPMGTFKLTELKADIIDTLILSHSNRKLAFSFRKMQKQFLAIVDIQNPKTLTYFEIPLGATLLSWALDELRIYLSQPQSTGSLLSEIYLDSKDKKSVALNAGYIAKESDNTLIYYSLAKQALIKKQNNVEHTLVHIDELNLNGAMPTCWFMREDSLFYCGRDANSQTIYTFDTKTKSNRLILQIPRDSFVTDIKTKPELTILYDTKSTNHSSLIEVP